MRHDAHHFSLWVDALFQPIRKQAEVVRADVLVAKVVHGKIRQYCQRFAVLRLKRNEREVGIFRAGLAGHIIPVAPGVHVGPHRFVAKRVFSQAVRAANPLPQCGELGGVRFGKSDACRHHGGLCGGDGLNEFLLQEGHVVRIRISAEATHGGRGRMRMRGGNEHAL